MEVTGGDMESTPKGILDLLIQFIELAKEIQQARRKEGKLSFEHKQELRRIRLVLNTVDVYALDPAIKPYYEQLLAIHRELVPQPSTLG